MPELKKAAELIKEDWEKIGVHVTLKVFEPSSFATEVLFPRKYDAIFYGQITGRSPDPYAYWHSSQRNAPGLNISLYANKSVDKMLEDARKEQDEAARSILLQKFNDFITIYHSPIYSGLLVATEIMQGMKVGHHN